MLVIGISLVITASNYNSIVSVVSTDTKQLILVSKPELQNIQNTLLMQLRKNIALYWLN